MSSKYVLEIKTVQIAPFRTLMTALKDILLETNITFQPDGMRIINMDKSHTILAHLFLDANKFEHYFCKYPKIVIGVNMFHLFKLINSIDNDGLMKGYDMEIVDCIKNIVSVPITLIGGAGSFDDIKKLLKKFHIIGAAAGSMFVFKGKYKAVLISYPNQEEKKYIFSSLD